MGYVNTNSTISDEDALLIEEVQPKAKPLKPFVPTSGQHESCNKSIEDLCGQLADLNKSMQGLKTQIRDLTKERDALQAENAMLKWSTPHDDVLDEDSEEELIRVPRTEQEKQARKHTKELAARDRHIALL